MSISKISRVSGAILTAVAWLGLSGCGSSSSGTNESGGRSAASVGVVPITPNTVVGADDEDAASVTVNTPWSNAQVAGGLYHSCVVKGGSAWCAGQNDHGQLGLGSAFGQTSYLTQVSGVSGLANVQMIAAGGYHTCALDGARGVWCWGSNQFGQLGDGSQNDSLQPVRVAGLESGVIALALGYQHSCAVNSRGYLYCWGNNQYGQLGNGSLVNQARPAMASYFSGGAKALALGANHSCATDANGKLWCWGYNGYGNLGDGTLADRKAAVQVQGIANRVVSVALGMHHSCAIDSQGSVLCWGGNQYKQLRNSAVGAYASRPVRALELDISARSLSAGLLHSCIGDGLSVQCWGDDSYGQQGLTGFSTAAEATRRTVRGIRGVVRDLASGGYHSCALVDGGYHCWGYGGYGQLASSGYSGGSAGPVSGGAAGFPGSDTVNEL